MIFHNAIQHSRAGQSGANVPFHSKRKWYRSILLCIIYCSSLRANGPDFVNFQKALQQWLSQKIEQNLIILMQKYEIIRFNTTYPRILQKAQQEAAYYGVDIES